MLEFFRRIVEQRHRYWRDAEHSQKVLAERNIALETEVRKAREREADLREQVEDFRVKLRDALQDRAASRSLFQKTDELLSASLERSFAEPSLVLMRELHKRARRSEKSLKAFVKLLITRGIVDNHGHRRRGSACEVCIVVNEAMAIVEGIPDEA